MDVMQELEVIAPIFRSGNYQEGFQELWKFWARIPEPKTETLNAYWTIETGVRFALRSGNLAQAERWSEMARPFKGKRYVRERWNFWSGK